MHENVPEDHPLRTLFRRALERAFVEFRALYTPEVAEHIGDHVLVEFVHTERLFRLRDLGGRTIGEVGEMLEVASEKEGPERRLEVDRYIGDFILFMGGFFPGFLGARPGSGAVGDLRPMVSRVGHVVVSFHRPIDYYVAEARNAYGRAAATARIFFPEAQPTLRRLGEHVEEYLQLVSRVKSYLDDDPQFREPDGILA
jgi:hypothetical protein